MHTFGSRLKNLRISKNLTQEQLTNEILKAFNYPLTATSLSLYENDKRVPPAELIIFLSKFFNCSTDYLLGIQDNSSEPEENIDDLKYLIINKFVSILNRVDIDTVGTLINWLDDLNKII